MQVFKRLMAVQQLTSNRIILIPRFAKAAYYVQEFKQEDAKGGGS
jgi:hypothetical protein